MGDTSPPKFPLKLLRWFCKPDYHSDIEGDLLELFDRRVEAVGMKKAKWLLLKDVLLLFRPGIIRSIQLGFPKNMTTMLKHNLRLSWRLLNKQRTYTAINIFGLTLSMIIAMFVMLWVQNEKSYDQFHKNINNIYKVLGHYSFGEEIITGTSVTYPLAEVLQENYSEVDKLVLTSNETTRVLQHEEIKARENGLFAGAEFFEIFSWDLLKGNKSEVLLEPSTVVLSTTLAEKYFGAEWSAKEIIGQTIQIGEVENYRITGVFADLPNNSSLQFDFVLSIDGYLRNRNYTDWNNSSFQLYLLLKNQVDAAGLSAAIKNIQNQHIQGFTSKLFLHPYKDIHLRSNFENGVLTISREEYYIRGFSIVALLIIFISSINFTNLAIARSMQRAKEIGIRKIVGAKRIALAGQFLSEYILLVVLAFILSVVLLPFLLPFFNSLIEKQIALTDFSYKNFLAFAGIGLATALLAGVYPALFLSSIKIMRGLKSFFRTDKRAILLRNGLVVFQLIISTLLILGSITVYRQLKYIQSKDLGLDREQVLFIRLEGALRNNYEAFKNEILKSPSIKSATSTSQNPLNISSTTHSFSWPGIDRTPDDYIHVITVDHDFLNVMDIELHAGRNFEKDRVSDTLKYLINERLLKYSGFKDPIGQQITIWKGSVGEVVGVVKDFHMLDFYSAIKPTLIRLQPEETRWFFMRTEKKSLQEAINHVETVYKDFNPNSPFEYRFLDESFNNTYRNEQVVSRLALCFTIFALIISCLGLIGLVTLAGEQRLKEVSLRKILGASPAKIMILLSRDLVRLVFIAFSLAVPFSILLLREWLNQFSYRVNLDFAVFALAGACLFLMTLFSISWYTFRVAKTNPVQSLRLE